MQYKGFCSPQKGCKFQVFWALTNSWEWIHAKNNANIKSLLSTQVGIEIFNYTIPGWHWRASAKSAATIRLFREAHRCVCIFFEWNSHVTRIVMSYQQMIVNNHNHMFTWRQTICICAYKQCLVKIRIYYHCLIAAGNRATNFEVSVEVNLTNL